MGGNEQRETDSILQGTAHFCFVVKMFCFSAASDCMFDACKGETSRNIGSSIPSTNFAYSYHVKNNLYFWWHLMSCRLFFATCTSLRVNAYYTIECVCHSRRNSPSMYFFSTGVEMSLFNDTLLACIASISWLLNFWFLFGRWAVLWFHPIPVPFKCHRNLDSYQLRAPQMMVGRRRHSLIMGSVGGKEHSVWNERHSVPFLRTGLVAVYSALCSLLSALPSVYICPFISLCLSYCEVISVSLTVRSSLSLSLWGQPWGRRAL